jgi:hypothetical protein
MGYVVLVDEPMEYVVDLPDGRSMVPHHLVVPIPRRRKKRRRVRKTEHTFVDGICTRCGFGLDGGDMVEKRELPPCPGVKG